MGINDATYTRMVKLRDKLEVRHREIKAEVEEIEQNLRAVSRTLALLDSEQPEAAEIEGEIATSVSPPMDISSLKGLTQPEALVKIAQHRGGRFLIGDAKKILVQAGLIKNPKNAGSIIFNVIQRSDRFNRVEPGVYEVRSDKPEKPTSIR